MIDRIAHLLRAEMALRAIEEVHANGSRELSDAVLNKIVDKTATELTAAMTAWRTKQPADPPIEPEAAPAPESPPNPVPRAEPEATSATTPVPAMTLSAAHIESIVRQAVLTTLAETKPDAAAEPVAQTAAPADHMEAAEEPQPVAAPTAPRRQTR